jgi:Tudor domain
MYQDLEAAVSKGVIKFGMFFLRENTYCLARVNGELLRVKVKSSNQETAKCLLIDNGATQSIPLSDLTLLPCMCWKLPPQVWRHLFYYTRKLIYAFNIQVVSFGLQGVSDDLHTKNPQALQFVQNSLQKHGTLHAVVEKAATSDRMDLLLYAQDEDQPKQLINRILLNEIVAKYLKPDLPLVSFVKLSKT